MNLELFNDLVRHTRVLGDDFKQKLLARVVNLSENEIEKISTIIHRREGELLDKTQKRIEVRRQEEVENRRKMLSKLQKKELSSLEEETIIIREIEEAIENI